MVIPGSPTGPCLASWTDREVGGRGRRLHVQHSARLGVGEPTSIGDGPGSPGHMAMMCRECVSEGKETLCRCCLLEESRVPE